jgi:phosphoribosylformylglycinamidine synthase
VTNNLNFGNPEKPEIMGQLAGCVAGMGEACRALDFPVISGNVSLYNETSGQAILPTPVIGGVGLIGDRSQQARAHLPGPGHDIVLIGETTGWLGASLYLWAVDGREEGAPPPVDLDSERRTGDWIRSEIGSDGVTACHDISDGGILVTLAEMALSGGTGVEIAVADDLPIHAWLFGEDQGRYLVATDDGAALAERAQAAGVSATIIGKTVDSMTLTVGAADPISLATLRSAHEDWLPNYMAG